MLEHDEKSSMLAPAAVSETYDGSSTKRVVQKSACG